MAQALYAVSNGATPFTSTTAIQTALTVVNAGTDFGTQIKKYRVSFAGTVSTNPSVTARFFSTNNATAGTSTAGTVTQEAGRVLAATNLTTAGAYTAEPTTKTYYGDSFLLSPFGGTAMYDFPLGDEPDAAFTSTLGIEITASAAVATMCSLWFSRI